jgi:hypothetical protein
MWFSWWSMKLRSSEHTERHASAISRAGRKERVCVRSSSGRDNNLDGGKAVLSDIDDDEADGANVVVVSGKVLVERPSKTLEGEEL